MSELNGMPALRDYLATRRTTAATFLDSPSPEQATLDEMLRIAARVPDHGKLAPWRFIVFEGAAQEAVGAAEAGAAGEAEAAAGGSTDRAAAGVCGRGSVSGHNEHGGSGEWDGERR